MAPLLAFGVGCGGKKHKNNDSPAPQNDGKGGAAAPGGQPGANPGTPAGNGEGGNGEGGNGPVVEEAKYDAKGGDLHTLTTKSKQWAAGAAEPEWTDGPDQSYEVVARYKDGLHCKYRLKSVDAAVPFAYDVGCEALQCDAPACEEKAIEAADVGDFHAAQGHESTCTQVVQAGPVKTLVKTVTKSWTHKDALREGQVVKSDATTCSLPLQGSEDGAGLDACSPPAGRTAQLTRSEHVLSAQTRGNGTSDLENEASSSFAVAGSFADPEGAKSSMTTCTLAAGKLSVMMTKSYCTAEHKADTYMLMLNQLPAQPGTDLASSAYGVFFQAQATNYMAATAGACRISYTADEAAGFLKGQATCDANALKVQGSSAAVSVTDVAFSCFAPESFFL
jgi:hypothetical protein